MMPPAFDQEEGNPLCNYHVNYRRMGNQNMITKLKRRELGYSAKSSRFLIPRSFYQNIVPNFTIVNIDRPSCFLRKFSPDGKYLIAFSADQTALEVYEYQGPSVAETLLKDWPDAEAAVEGVNDSLLVEIRSRIFHQCFKLKHTVQVATNGEQLNRECSLFTDDSQYVIVGSELVVSDESQLHYFDIYRTNESISISNRLSLQDYTLYLVDIPRGRLCDSRTFKTDKIFLPHNQGIYLYNKTLSVLSVQHQIIHLFRLDLDPLFGDAKLIDLKKIGRFCYSDDEYITSVPTGSPTQNDGSWRNRRLQAPVRAYRETSISSLKHRFLVNLFQQSKEGREGCRFNVRTFYQNFDHLLSLRMWKMQLLDEQHILVKYANEDVITFRSTELNNPTPFFFAIYNIDTAQVIAVYDNASQEFLNLFENFCDYFRNSSPNISFPNISCSPSNNSYSKANQQKYKQTMINARNGGTSEATKRLLSQLPISAQSYSPSPYLDLNLFSYDEKLVSVMERPKPCGDVPIRFYARDSELLRFRIIAGNSRPRAQSNSGGNRRLVAFIFHPFDPFAISVQRTNADYVVNVHLRHIKS